MKLLLVCVLLVCALSTNLKESAETTTVEEVSEEVEMGTNLKVILCPRQYRFVCDGYPKTCHCKP